MHITITRSPSVSVEHRAAEIVERKGVGHPDTLCDRAAEELSVALSRHYRAHAGAILHHNTDKALLVGGRAEARFGGGEVIEPSYLLLSGRATQAMDGHEAPVGEIAVAHTAEWLARALPHMRVPGDIVIDARIKPSSPDLIDLYRRPGVPVANDTSFAVAFAPPSALERAVLAAETLLNSPDVQARYPQLGQDIKVMGLRSEGRIHITVAAAFVAQTTPDLDTYLGVKAEVASDVRALVATLTGREVQVHVNAADDPARGIVYLTVTGSSIEQGDDGEVGRGNRATGLITPMRPMTLEAAAGKNPVSHTGKVYQVYAQLIVDRLVADLPEVRAATCALLSRIGAPINEPQAVVIQVESDVPEAALADPITGIVRHALGEWAAVRDGFLERTWRLF